MAFRPCFLSLLPFLFILSLSSRVSPSTTSPSTASPSRVDPFTAKAALIRYWNRKIRNNRPHPPFFLSKLSPLSLPQSAASFPSAGNLTSFCSAARILCPNSTAEALPVTSSSRAHSSDFSAYQNSNYTNYGTGATSGGDSFSKYSPELNIPVDSFRRYERGSSGRNDSFSVYDPDGNVVTANFTSYASEATGGFGKFSAYAGDVNVPQLGFSNYDAAANGRTREFASYSRNANSGAQSFAGYGKNGNGDTEAFTSYANGSNVIASGFANYGEDGNGATDTFSVYDAEDSNVPENNFRNYGSGGNAGSDRFISYRDQSNVGDDTFASYAKNANAGDAEFENYGNSVNDGSDSFSRYGEGDNPNHHISFNKYFEDNTTFKAYAKSGVGFSQYRHDHSSVATAAVEEPAKRHSRWAVEPGKFFREKELVTGNVMPMPDIRDKLPPRAFLPRAISEKIPFTADEVMGAFGIGTGTALAKAVADTMGDCNRAPSRGETKKCAASAEDMIDFAVSVLGDDIVVRSTESAAGSGQNVTIGEVKGINGGRVTRSVSCHQSLFPYLVYYCHSVPKVRLYEAEILSVQSDAKINHGVAICHLDTSDWGPTHGAFVALGGKPGEIEVCHWIFQGDMTWATAD